MVPLQGGWIVECNCLMDGRRAGGIPAIRDTWVRTQSQISPVVFEWSPVQRLSFAGVSGLEDILDRLKGGRI